MDDPQYRPARSKDFEQAVNRIDTNDLETSPRTTTPTTATPAAPYDASTHYAVDERSHAPLTRTDLGTQGGTAVHRGVGTHAGAREEVVTERVHERAGGDPPRPFSIAAGFFGWATASFFTLVLATITLALLGAAAYDATNAGTTGVTADTFNSLTTGGLVALLASVFLAYLLGGYVAGRIGLWHGIAHGVAVVAWTILFTVLTIALAAWLGDAVVGLYVLPAIDWTALTGYAILGLVLTLAAMLLGSIPGAKLGTRPYGIDGAYRRRARTLRGRPL